MSKCNYCTVEAIKRHAANVGEVVTVRPVKRPYADGNLILRAGYTVYLHPPEITIPEDQVHQLNEEAPPFFAAWLAALPDHCVCGED